jgi:tetratricopeptide (TPR) repeat protein
LLGSWHAYERARRSQFEGDVQGVIDWCSIGIRANPDALELYRLRAEIFQSLGERHKAIEDYILAGRLDGSDTFVVAGKLLEQAGEMNQAAESYANAIIQSSGHIGQLERFAKLYGHNEPAEALADWLAVMRNAAERRPSDGRLHEACDILAVAAAAARAPVIEDMEPQEEPEEEFNR